MLLKRRVYIGTCMVPGHLDSKTGVRLPANVLRRRGKDTPNKRIRTRITNLDLGEVGKEGT